LCQTIIFPIPLLPLTTFTPISPQEKLQLATQPLTHTPPPPTHGVGTHILVLFPLPRYPLYVCMSFTRRGQLAVFFSMAYPVICIDRVSKLSASVSPTQTQTDFFTPHPVPNLFFTAGVRTDCLVKKASFFSWCGSKGVPGYNALPYELFMFPLTCKVLTNVEFCLLRGQGRWFSPSPVDHMFF